MTHGVSYRVPPVECADAASGPLTLPGYPAAAGCVAILEICNRGAIRRVVGA